MDRLSTIGFDADDTLWQNEQFYRRSEAAFCTLLAPYAGAAEITGTLQAIEGRRLDLYGAGIKGHMLAMLETAATLVAGDMPARLVCDILALGRAQLQHEIELLPHAEATLAALHGRYRLVLITKGDLKDQERKVAASGLAGYFDAIEIVSDKRPGTYEDIFRRHGDGAARAMMVGNSLKSDILPALAAGAWGVFVPHPLTWHGEQAAAPERHDRFRTLATLGELEAVVGEIG